MAASSRSLASLSPHSSHLLVILIVQVTCIFSISSFKDTAFVSASLPLVAEAFAEHLVVAFLGPIGLTPCVDAGILALRLATEVFTISRHRKLGLAHSMVRGPDGETTTLLLRLDLSLLVRRPL